MFTRFLRIAALVAAGLVLADGAASAAGAAGVPG